MRVSRIVLAASIAVSVVLAAANVYARRGEGAGVSAPSSGRLLDVDSTLAEQPVRLALLSGSNVEQVVDVDVSGDTAWVLGRTQWRGATGSVVLGPFGSSIRGAPGFIAAAQQIFATPAGIFVLDRASATIIQWSREGEVQRRFSLPTGSSAVMHEFVAGANGLPIAVAQGFDATAAIDLLILRLHGERARADTLLVQHNSPSVFTLPRLAQQHASLVLGNPFDHTLTWITNDGVVHRTVGRSDAPIWLTPDSLRGGFAERIGSAPGSTPATFAMPDTLPSLRFLDVTTMGRIIKGIDPGTGTTAFELYDSAGAPVGRLPLPASATAFFLTRAGVVWLSESVNATEILLMPIQ